MKYLLLIGLVAASGWLAAQTVSTLVPGLAGDDLHYGADGYLYSSIYGGYHFRRIDPNTGHMDTILQVNTPTIGAIEVDDNLNIYTCSYENGWFGNFKEGDSDIDITHTGLAGPAGIARDEEGNLYVATNQDHSIVKISPEGTQSTYAQGIPLFWPTGITTAPDGNLYIANLYNGRLCKVTPGGGPEVLATLPGIGTDANPDLAYVTWAAGKLFLCHFGSHKIYQVNPENGDTLCIAGTGHPGHIDGPAQEAAFEHPTGIAASPTGDTLFVTDGVAPDQRLRMIVLATSTAVQNTANEKEEIKLLSAMPIKESLQFEVFSEHGSELNLQILNVSGQIMREDTLWHTGSGKQACELNLAQLPSGNYYLKVWGKILYPTVGFIRQ